MHIDTQAHVAIANTRTGRVLSNFARVAITQREKAIGLLTQQAAGDGLWIAPPAQSIHTFGMLFPIDVLFLDGDWRVLGYVMGLGSGQYAAGPQGTHSVVELAAGMIKASETQAGDRLELTPIG